MSEGATTMQSVRLADGRVLEFWVSGPADGLPFVFHHGTPGAGTPVRALERAVHARGWPGSSSPHVPRR